MSFALPTVLALTQNRHARAADADDHTTPDVSASLEGRLAEALLGDAVLTLEDMPAGWYDAEPAAESLFAKTEYASILLAGLRVALGHEASGVVVDQEIAVLPRWTMRHPHQDARSRVDDLIAGGQRHASTGDDGGAVAVAPRIAVEAAGASVIRRGTIVMALRFEGNVSTDVIAEITAAAESKCEQIAEVLR